MTVATINKVIRGNYSIEIEERFAKCDNGRPSYKVTCTDITTNEINEEMSDTIYLSMNAVNEFINSIEETKVIKKTKKSITAPKTIKFDDLMKVMKKYVATSQTRPILTFVKYDGEYFTATNSHILLRVKAQHVSDIPVDGQFLYDPKNMEIPTDYNVSSYPETARLIPQYNNSTVLIDKNIKEFSEQVKAAKKLLKSKDGHISLDFTQKDLTLRTVESITDKKYTKHNYINEVKLNNVHIEGEELVIKTSHKYMTDALETAKKLSKLSTDHVEMKMNGHLRPMHITQYNVFDLMVLPIRTY
jgi:hypothetical protein